MAYISPASLVPAMPVAVAIKQGVVAGTKAVVAPAYGLGTGVDRPTPVVVVMAYEYINDEPGLNPGRNVAA